MYIFMFYDSFLIEFHMYYIQIYTIYLLVNTHTYTIMKENHRLHEILSNPLCLFSIIQERRKKKTLSLISSFFRYIFFHVFIYFILFYFPKKYLYFLCYKNMMILICNFISVLMLDPALVLLLLLLFLFLFYF